MTKEQNATNSCKGARCRVPSPHHQLTQTITFATPAALEKIILGNQQITLLSDLW